MGKDVNFSKDHTYCEFILPSNVTTVQYVGLHLWDGGRNDDIIEGLINRQ